MDKTEKQLSIYSSLLIALLLNSGRLMALRDNSLVSLFWRFNLPEFIFQIAGLFTMCYLIFYLNLKDGLFSTLRIQKKYILYTCLYAGLLFGYTIAVGVIQRIGFRNVQFRGVFWVSYLNRAFFSGILTGIILKIILLIRESKKHIQEKEQIKNAYVMAELELLKEQLNPHFLFNSLSSLSGIIRENPVLAQQYVKHLSKVFRYTLAKPVNNLVTVADEYVMVQSFAQLLSMRMEDTFLLEVDIPDHFLNFRLPHLSLQPLLENAAKHTLATRSEPLKIKLYTQDGFLVVVNNLRQIPENQEWAAESTGLGLLNLNERFKILMGQEIIIQKTDVFFSVKLPVKNG